MPLGPPPLAGDSLAWAAVAFWAGIMLWLWLPEPPQRGLSAGLLLLLAAVLMGLALPAAGSRRGMILALAAAGLAGLGWMALRVALAATPMLPAHVGMADIAGTVERVWMSGPRKARLQLRVLALPAVAPAHRPHRVRLTLRIPRRHATLARAWQTLPLPGDEIEIRAWLRRLPQPVAPGAHDPALFLWLAGTGATAHAHLSALKVRRQSCAAGPCPPALWLARALERWRRGVAAGLEAAMSVPAATALAQALLTGTRNALPEEERDRLRAAGLAHILAISGLHLALVAGTVFWLLRAVMALSPWLALHWPIRQLAALAALAAAFLYMLLSGNSVATQRAFVMLAVATLAVVLGRRAVTMRNLGMAAFAVLLLRPEAAFTAGFQMSFAAVMGLVAAWEAVEFRRMRREAAVDADPADDSPLARFRRHLKRLLVATLALTLSTVVAGAMTALPAVWHFQQLTPWSLLGNIVALPVLSLWVMPLGLAGLALQPLGLEALPWWLMEQGLRLILAWSRWVAALPDAMTVVPQPSALAAVLAVIGIVLLALRRDGLRLLGLVPLLAAVLLAPPRDRPWLLVSADGRAVAVRNGEGRLVPAPSSTGDYVLRMWLRRDGDAATPEEARRRPAWRCTEIACRAMLPGRRIVLLRPLPRGRRRSGDLAERERVRQRAQVACRDLAADDVVIAPFPLRGACRQAGRRIDRFDLWRHGAHALFRHGGTWTWLRTSDVQGRFPWGRSPLPRREVILMPARAASGSHDEAGSLHRGFREDPPAAP